MFYNKKIIYHRIILFLSFIITSLSVFFEGFIKINTQQLTRLNTYSGGFPCTFFEIYYFKNETLNFDFIISHILASNLSFKIDFFPFILDFALFNYLIVLFIKNFPKLKIKVFK